MSFFIFTPQKELSAATQKRQGLSKDVVVNEMTYSEWVRWKETGKKPEPQIPATPKKTSAMRRDPAKFRQLATESATNVETPEEYSKKIADKHGISIDISEAGKLTDEAKEQVAAIDKLLDEYNSTMVDYRLVKGGFYDKDGGQCYMKDGKSAVSVKTSTIKRNGSQDRLNLGDNSHLMTTYHEFAHSLSQSRENTDPDFWKDVKKVRTQYRKEIKGIDKAELVDHTMNTSEAIAAKKKIFISDYAEKDIDEFLADAFAQAKLSSNPSPYAEEVLKTVDKYFKKPIESSSKRSIIKAEMTDTDRKAILDYMSAKSYSINEKLRTGKALDNQEQKFVDSLDAALKKAPKYSGNLSRSLIFDSSDDVSAFVKDYQPGNKVAYREFLSTTKGKTLYNPNGQVQIYIKDSKNGRDISLLNPREEEVLYERNASFKVENIVEQDGKYYILVVEDNE